MNILKSKTGMLHMGANSASNCNGRSGKFSHVDVKSAYTSGKVCKKCFPCGLDYAVIQGEVK
jgi:hypothetical protein